MLSLAKIIIKILFEYNRKDKNLYKILQSKNEIYMNIED